MLSVVKNNSSFPLNNHIYDIVNSYHIEVKDLLEKMELGILDLDIKFRDKYEEVKELWTIFVQFRGELIRHLENEEVIIFPTIISIEQAFVGGIKIGIMDIKELVKSRVGGEHDEIRTYIDNIVRLLEESRIVDLGEANYKDILEKAKMLKSNLYEHGITEDEILYPQAIEMYESLNK